MKNCPYIFAPIINPRDLGLNEMRQRDRQLGSLNSDALSPREREVTLLVAKGFANKTIAQKLNVAEGTVKVHLHRVYQKFGISQLPSPS